MDEEYRRIDWDTPISELMHCDEGLSYVDLDEGELAHFKYIKRKKLPNGKWRYYYDKDELKKDAKSIIDKVRDKFSSITSGKKTNTKKKNSFVSRLKSVASGFDSIINKAKKTTHKYIAKVPTKGGTYRYFYSDKAYKAYLNGKNAVDKALDKTGNKKIGSLIKDVVKDKFDGIVSDVMKSGFGKAVYNVALPALTAVQVAIQTPKSISDMKKIKGEQTNDEHQKTINPEYDPKKFDYSYNCSFCTAAYDLRKRGYDVEAMPISVLEGPVIEDIVSWYEGAKAVSEDTIKLSLNEDKQYSGNYLESAAERHQRRAAALTDSLEAYGDGARGHLAMYWRMGGGHDIVWEVENGDVVFRDCQTNEIVNITETLTYVNNYSFVRVDNCEITEEVLRTVRNRK